ncbi:membrane metallo-endopeptidase-like 1 [Prorops nasuta]|uniref:membrane metallo-endopeptidase-like 1 n=1 Tax=Prorops nasuta TaxID=863751 RepID=UPI0034CFBD24
MDQFVIFLLLIFFIAVTMGRVEICETETCIKLASTLKRGIKPSINPCDDFYEHVCGAWRENYPVSNAISYIDLHSFLHRNLDNRIIDILKSTSASASSESLLQARKLYNTCKHATVVDKDGPKSLLTQLEKRGDWLLLSHKPASPPTIIWQNYLKMEYQFLLGNPLFGIDIGEKMQSSNTRIIIVKQPDLFLPESNDKESQDHRNMMKSYDTYIRDVASFLKKKRGQRTCNTILKQDIDNMIQFELKLAEKERMRCLKNQHLFLIFVFNGNQYKTPETYRLIKTSGHYRPMCIRRTNNRILHESFKILRIQDFQNIYDENGGNHTNAQINWLEIIQFQFKTFGYNIDSSEMVKVYNMQFFRKLPILLQATDSRTIANYIIWSFVRLNINFSGKTLISKKNKYEDKINGDGVVGGQSEFICSDNPNLYKAISLEYVKRYFPDSNKRKVSVFIYYFPIYG